MRDVAVQLRIRVVVHRGTVRNTGSSNLPRPDPIGRHDDTVNDELPVDVFLDGYPPEMRATAHELRRIVTAAVPDAMDTRSGRTRFGPSRGSGP